MHKKDINRNRLFVKSGLFFCWFKKSLKLAKIRLQNAKKMILYYCQRGRGILAAIKRNEVIVMGFVVAIDGPAGSGKGTITKLVAEKRNLVSIDTGAMYRCVALECLNNGVEPTDLVGIQSILEKIEIELKNEDGIKKVYLNGKDVSKEIREPRVDDVVAKYAAIKQIRDKMTPMQQKMGETQNIIMEGRDIGTVVFPNADVKIFLDCSLEERANRRYKQDLEKGIKTTYEEVLQSIIERHKLETEREIAPFVKAEDAVVVDSTHLSIDEVVEEILKIIDAKMSF